MKTIAQSADVATASTVDKSGEGVGCFVVLDVNELWTFVTTVVPQTAQILVGHSPDSTKSGQGRGVKRVNFAIVVRLHGRHCMGRMKFR